MIDFIYRYGFEVAGTVASLIYLFYSIREKAWLWPWGIVASVVSLIVFYQSALYADMGLQLYYVIISIYGWWYWISGQTNGEQTSVPIKGLRWQLLAKLTVVGSMVYFLLLGALLYIPAMVDIASSDLPYLDSLTTAASIIATWLLARKYIHHWLFWVGINTLSMGMYLYKGLYFYSFLFLVYTVGAVVGYMEWKRLMVHNAE
ncbi:nicotinamide mononucleotide transporter [Carboxylicivirga sp. A043]|uniref:nicotinamide riboside transporter PnuC n=1 Tax=Carboxylicivirga litoralis TaxID=2816963 RepID=UPI0021CB2AF6|nr:nicotinamide riboside transporter PnuC [Carboxylicivirga sp. A043]MCU4157360.1 nicotinamide mononucleotide transporter [Carboxylicivirga sp. A043]